MTPWAPVPSPPRTTLFSTSSKPWADVISCSYEMQHTLRGLVPLKAFLLVGTTVTIVEEKVGALPGPRPVLWGGLCGPAPRSAPFQKYAPRSPCAAVLTQGRLAVP